MYYQFFRKESTLFTKKHASRMISHNIIGRIPSMGIPLLANQDLTPMLLYMVVQTERKKMDSTDPSR